MALDLEGIAVSTGSACSSGSINPSKVLLGMGLSEDEALQTVRFSLDKRVCDGQMQKAAEATCQVIRKMRGE